MNVKHLPLLSLCAFPQLTDPVMVFRTSLRRGTSLIRCFLIIWAQTMKAKVRFAYLLIGYTNKHYHVTNIVLIIVMIGLSVFEEGSFQFFFFSFRRAYVSTYEVSWSLQSTGASSSPSQILNLLCKKDADVCYKNIL